MNIRKTISIALLVTAAVGAQAQAGISLKPGSLAPALNVAKFVKGQKVDSFKKGNVYVVEFWATWCGPCKQSIPHLTELAKKFKGKATIVGVSVWERQKGETGTAYIPKVEQFVKEMGSNMDYTVAVDGPEDTMSKTWMTAAGQNGIPTAFVVGRDGKIAWIGHPMAGLDNVLEQVIENKFDAAAYAERQQREQDAQAKTNNDLQPIIADMESGNMKEALGKLNALITKKPEMEKGLCVLKLNLMFEADEANAYPYAQKIADSFLKDNADALNQIAWQIVGDVMPLKSPDFKVALHISQRANEVAKGKDSYILDTLAYAYYKSGDVKSALKYQQMAVDILPTSTTKADPETEQEIRERLAKYKKEVGG